MKSINGCGWQEQCVTPTGYHSPGILPQMDVAGNAVS